MAIRTPDQRLRVFVSSTLQELAPERRAVREAIESLRLTPVMFEQGARPHPPRALYRAYLEQSEVFVGLYWERYGWVAPDEEVSGLEDEYRLADGLPRLIYLKAPAPGREPRLTALLDRIRSDDRVSYRAFADAAELRSLVADDLALLLTERFSAAAESAPRAHAAVRRPLPRPLTRLIGRDAEIERVVGLLGDPEMRLVTLVGPGGIGKTRLALAVAERVAGGYTDGVAYVDLAPLSEPALVLSAIAEATGLREATGLSLGIALRESLADAEMLIVLDNMEQLLDAASDLSDLLAAAAKLQLLVTSRSILNLRGEQTFDVEPLSLPSTKSTRRVGVESSGAVELFLDRARAVRPGYAPDGDELAAIAEICARLDGLPLAIELASARTRTLSAQAILARMGHRRLSFLRGGARDLPARQQALRETIAWSHSLLETDAQTLFARLGVFVGSAGLDAIESVSNPDGSLPTLDLLAVLVDGSLVRAMGEADEPRFGMLETIREYAVEQLEASGEADGLRARHEAHYVALAEEGERALGTSRQIEWLGRLNRENDNFRAILRRAIRRKDAVAAVRLARAMALVWQIRSTYGEGRQWSDAIVGLPTATSHERAVAWTIGGLLAFWQGDFEILETRVAEIIRVAGEAGDLRTLGLAHLVRAMAASVGPIDEDVGRRALDAATQAFDADGEPLMRGVAIVSRAYVAGITGRIDEAIELAQSAYDLSSGMGEWYIRTVASTILARTSITKSDPGATRHHALEALKGAQQLRNLGAAGYALELWAVAELAEARPERAARLHALSARAYREVGSTPWRTELDLHRSVERQLTAALGARLDDFMGEARVLEMDAAITELATSQPASAV